ncbi:MAG: type II toxin-antitoxin system VapC family toxin [Chloroflexi bacterium]|nr:type II toxin-antitoxin system VapC family toxin [Chloroflexota bacterium]
MTSGASGTASTPGKALEKCLLDSGILIQHLRASPQAAAYLTKLRVESNPCVSVATAAELLVGCSTEKQVQATEEFLKAFEILPIDYSVAQRAAQLIRSYPGIFGKEIARGFADALIAATAWVHGIALHTLNVRHFARTPIPEIVVHVVDQTADVW